MEQTLPALRWQAWKFRWWRWIKMATSTSLTLKPWYVQLFEVSHFASPVNRKPLSSVSYLHRQDNIIIDKCVSVKGDMCTCDASSTKQNLVWGSNWFPEHTSWQPLVEQTNTPNSHDAAVSWCSNNVLKAQCLYVLEGTNLWMVLDWRRCLTSKKCNNP